MIDDNLIVNHTETPVLSINNAETLPAPIPSNLGETGIPKEWLRPAQPPKSSDSL